MFDFESKRKLYSPNCFIRARPYWFKAPLLVAERCVCGHYYSVDEHEPFSGKAQEHRCRLELKNWLEDNQINLHQTGRNYWKNVFDRIRNERVWYAGSFPGKDYLNGRYFFDPVVILRQWRYQERENKRAPHQWKHDYDARINTWIQQELKKAVEEINDSCVDNERWAETTNKGHMRHYNKWKSQGCCGFYDEEIIDSQTGRTFMIGFNYGH